MVSVALVWAWIYTISGPHPCNGYNQCPCLLLIDRVSVAVGPFGQVSLLTCLVNGLVAFRWVRAYPISYCNIRVGTL